MVVPTLEIAAPPSSHRGLAASARQAATWLVSKAGRGVPSIPPGVAHPVGPRVRLPRRTNALRTRPPSGLWQRAMALAAKTHRVVQRLPAEVAPDGSSHAPVGPPATACRTAPGQGLAPASDYGSFLRATVGSLFELQTLLTVARELEYIDEQGIRGVWAATQQLEHKLTNLGRRPRST